MSIPSQYSSQRSIDFRNQSLQVLKSCSQKRGGRREDRIMGIASAILGAYVVLNGKSSFWGYSLMGLGTSLIHYSSITPDEEYDSRRARREALIGFLSGSAGQGVSYFLKPITGYELLKKIANVFVSNVVQVWGQSGRAPNRREWISTFLISGLSRLTHSGISQALNSENDTLVAKAIVGGLAGAASGGMSNALSNTLKKDPEPPEKHFAISATLGAFTGAVSEVREEMDRRDYLRKELEKTIQKAAEEQEAIGKKLNEERLAIETKQAALVKKEQSLSEAEKTAIQKKQDTIHAMNRKYGQYIDSLLANGYKLTNQNLNSKEKILEQIVVGEQLTFHKYHKGKEVGKASFKDQSLKDQYYQAISEYNSLQTDRRSIQAERSALHTEMEGYNQKVPGSFTKENGYQGSVEPVTQNAWQKKLQDVSAQLKSTVEDLQGRGYKLTNKELNGNVDKIMEQLAMDHELAFKKGDKRKYIKFKPPVEISAMKKEPPGETLLESARLMAAIYESYPEKYMRKHLPDFSKVASDKVGIWDLMLVKNNRTNEYSVVFHGILGLFDSTAIAAAAHHIKKPEKLIREMGKIIDRWNKHELQGKHHISNFYGHSHGGYFATHVKSSWKIKRITFNGHNIKRGDLRINLKSEKDIVSDKPLGVDDRYITVVPGDHSVKNLIREIESRCLGWSDILT